MLEMQIYLSVAVQVTPRASPRNAASSSRRPRPRRLPGPPLRSRRKLVTRPPAGLTRGLVWSVRSDHSHGTLLTGEHDGLVGVAVQRLHLGHERAAALVPLVLPTGVEVPARRAWHSMLSTFAFIRATAACRERSSASPGLHVELGRLVDPERDLDLWCPGRRGREAQEVELPKHAVLVRPGGVAFENGHANFVLHSTEEARRASLEACGTSRLDAPDLGER